MKILDINLSAKVAHLIYHFQLIQSHFHGDNLGFWKGNTSLKVSGRYIPGIGILCHFHNAKYKIETLQLIKL